MNGVKFEVVIGQPLSAENQDKSIPTTFASNPSSVNIIDYEGRPNSDFKALISPEGEHGRSWS